VKSGTWVQAQCSVSLDYLIVAGGGGGGSFGGGAGAGGYRTSFPGGTVVTASYYPGQSIPVTVGAGGTGGVSRADGTSGSPSIFSTITSAGGGKGGSESGTTYWNSWRFRWWRCYT
jgi:hypothetical protein